MLDFIPAQSIQPWDFVFQNLITEIPPGKFYYQDIDMVPRGTKPTEFLLFTDRYADSAESGTEKGYKVSIYVNGTLLKKLVPLSSIVRVKMYLAPPPSSNFITVTNGVDEPVNLSVASTHIATHMQAMAQQNYAFMWNLIEKYYYAMRSPWATFFVEYQLPFKKYLPDIRELRILSVKMLANSLYGEYGLAGAIPDVISAFSVSTPAIVGAGNKELFQPDLFQPVLSGEDESGFEAHVWFANTCLNQWLAFVTLMDNLDAYSLRRFNEDSVIINVVGTENYQQHLFNTSGPSCSVRGLIESLGCMDNITVTLATHIISRPAICLFANPFDKMVEKPGIGGSHFDSGKTFDGEYGPFDSLYDIDPFTDYWVKTSTSKHFDMGMCLDTYNVGVQTPNNTECCSLGPTTKMFSTTVCEDSVVSAVTPHHPVFGGGPNGLLSNPVFGTLFV